MTWTRFSTKRKHSHTTNERKDRLPVQETSRARISDIERLPYLPLLPWQRLASLPHNFPTHRQPRHQIPYTQLPPLSSLLSPRLTEREKPPKVFKKKYLRPSPDARSYAQCRNNPSDNLFALFSKPCHFMCQDNITLASPGYPFSTSTYSSYSPASFSSLPTLRRHRRHSMLSWAVEQL